MNIFELPGLLKQLFYVATKYDLFMRIELPMRGSRNAPLVVVHRHEKKCIKEVESTWTMVTSLVYYNLREDDQHGP